MRHPLTTACHCFAGCCVAVLCATGAWAQQGERAPLRADLQAAAEHLMHHPHPYAMTEEVARVRLEKFGFERTQSLQPTAHNTFQAEVMKNGEARRVEIDRITGELRPLQ
ncbi:MAG TPA: hypothetical protein VHJ00_11170 [Bradyrhizobium sp.]|jgi:hypothetical protein|nr:hypothetical protein [Bradyrhizobium sp.]